jgi:hypothetical protein
MEDGTLVTFGASGTVVYKTYRVDDPGWDYKYTLVPVNGGRKRYRVTAYNLRPYVAPEVPPVNTSRGSVKRPKTFRRYSEYSGCTRRAYVGREWVFKVAKYAGDNFKNRVEAAHYAVQSGMSAPEAIKKFGEDAVMRLRRYEGVPIAECHLLPDGVLMMERVKSINNLNADEGADMLSHEEKRKFGYRRPEWARHVDCEQIGYNTKGELVAYDL